MDNNININSLSDLYRLVLPALKTRKNELKREGINYISELDIWNYLKSSTWENKRDLRIYEIVNDILNVDGIKVGIYVRDNIVNYKKLIEKE